MVLGKILRKTRSNIVTRTFYEKSEVIDGLHKSPHAREKRLIQNENEGISGRQRES